MKVKGVLERASATEVFGWAYSPDAPPGKLKVSVLTQDGRHITSTASNFRRDLKAAGIGDGHHGFRIQLSGAVPAQPLQVFAEAPDGTMVDLPYHSALRNSLESDLFPSAKEARHYNLRFEFEKALAVLKNGVESKEVLAPLESAVRLNQKHYEFKLLRNFFSSPVDDPYDRGIGAKIRPCGIWSSELTDKGLQIKADVLVDTVLAGIFVDDLLVKIVKLNERKGNAFSSSFSFCLQSTFREFPKSFNLSVSTPFGPLVHSGSGNVHRSFKDHSGTSRLRDCLSEGYVVESHGHLIKLRGQETEWKQSTLRWYDAAREYFEQKFGKKLYLNYGTLLGFCRDSDFIAHDGDFDTAYLSGYSNPEDVKKEAIEIVQQLLNDSHNVTIVSKGGFFRPEFEGRQVDIFPAWIESGKLWMHNTTAIDADSDLVEPIQVSSFKGVRAYIPNNAELFLERKYGADWRIPDPSYVPSAKNQAVVDHLAKMIITDKDIEKLKTGLPKGNVQRK